MNFKGKRVLITGASSGIGKACAEIYAENGADLILTGRRADRLKEIALNLENKYSVNVSNYIFDIRSRKATENFGRDLESLGLTPNVFINNAGLAKGLSPIYEGDEDAWDEMIDTNIKGFLYAARAVIPLMIKKGTGHIINMGSIAGTQVYPGGNVYNATKYAVKALSRAMNLDLLKTDIRVCVIEPGAVETEFSLVRFDGDNRKASAVYEGYEALKPEDIAQIIYFVTSLPERVNVQSLLVTPTAQRAASLINKNI